MRGRRDGRVQASVEHFLRHSGRVVADFGEADVTVDDLEPGTLQCGLQRAQLAPVFVHGHERSVALVAEH